MDLGEMRTGLDKDFYGMKIPDHMWGGIERYINEHIPPGEFLQAIICNDLREAVGRADDENIVNIPAFVSFFYNYAPGNCWGSIEEYKEWLKQR